MNNLFDHWCQRGSEIRSDEMQVSEIRSDEMQVLSEFVSIDAKGEVK
jgi:hypothetical protein